jgi:DNA-binding GntR family transcriptional regulator
MTEYDWANDLRNMVDLKARPSLAAEIAEYLREFILVGKLAPGLPVRERELAETFGISRTPLKEALRILETEGLIEYGPTRRPRVADPSISEINDWLRVQGALESLAGELVCNNASDEQIDKVETINKGIMEASDLEGQLAAFRTDMEFHEAIVAVSGNKALVETHAIYNARLWRVRFLSSQRGINPQTTLKEHKEILDALKRRDAVGARRALKRHLQTAESNIAATFKARSNET